LPPVQYTHSKNESALVLQEGPGGKWQSVSPVISIYIAEKDVLPSLLYQQNEALSFLEWVYCTGGKVFRGKLVHSVAEAIIT